MLESHPSALKERDRQNSTCWSWTFSSHLTRSALPRTDEASPFATARGLIWVAGEREERDAHQHLLWRDAFRESRQFRFFSSSLF